MGAVVRGWGSSFRWGQCCFGKLLGRVDGVRTVADLGS